MFERFTETARTVVVRSQVIAAEGGDPKIEPIHLSLGASEENSTIATKLDGFGLTTDVLKELLNGHGESSGLTALGIDYESVQLATDRTFGDGALERAENIGSSGFGRRRPLTKRTRFANSAKISLETAFRVALERRDSFVCDAHVAIGALLTRQGALSMHLALAGIDVPELRKELADCVVDG